MLVKTEVVNRWQILLEGDPPISVTSIDGDEKSIKVRIGTTERIVSVDDWMSLATAVRGKVKYSPKR